MNVVQLREFVKLENERAEIEERLKALKQRQDELEQALIPQFIADGMDAMKLDGRTIGIKRDIFASPRDGNKQAVIDGFKQNDEVKAYVKEDFNSASVSKWVREIAADVREQCEAQDKLFDEKAIEAALPAPLNQALKVAFVFKLTSRKAS